MNAKKPPGKNTTRPPAGKNPLKRAVSDRDLLASPKYTFKTKIEFHSSKGPLKLADKANLLSTRKKEPSNSSRAETKKKSGTHRSRESKEPDVSPYSPDLLVRARSPPTSITEAVEQADFHEVGLLKFKILHKIFKNRWIKDSDFNTICECLTDKFPGHQALIKKILVEIVTSLDQ